MLQPVPLQFNIVPDDAGKWRWEIVRMPSGTVSAVCSDRYPSIGEALASILVIKKLEHLPIREAHSGNQLRGPSAERRDAA